MERDAKAISFYIENEMVDRIDKAVLVLKEELNLNLSRSSVMVMLIREALKARGL